MRNISTVQNIKKKTNPAHDPDENQNTWSKCHLGTLKVLQIKKCAELHMFITIITECLASVIECLVW